MIRHHKRFQIDLLFGVSVIYLICFGIVPVFIFKTDLSYYSDMHWIKRIPQEDSAYLFAAITSLIGYVLILTGYHFAKRVRISRKASYKSLYGKKIKGKVSIIYPERKMSLVAMFLFMLGTISLLIYVYSIGGIKIALETASLYRSGRGPIASRWLFLKNVAPLVMIASYFYYALRFNETNKRRQYTILFVISFVISLYLLMLLSGRLSLVRYLVIFPLFRVLYKKKGNIRFIIISVVLALLIILFGDPLFRAFNDPTRFFYYIHSVRMSISDISRLVLTEFSFPYINLVNLLSSSREVNFRFFSDIFIGIATLLPQSLLGIRTPATLSRINTNYFGTFGTIPVDLVSFGYYSLSIPGVVLVTFVFGIIIRLFDVFFPPQKTAIESIFRAAWIIFLAFRVMYGDVSLIVQGGFELFVGTILLANIRTKQYEKAN
jgi:oligosaccharide repeat unit polymerase